MPSNNFSTFKHQIVVTLIADWATIFKNANFKDSYKWS